MPLYTAEEKGYIALANPPAQTNVGADTVLTFLVEVNHVIIQNNASININYAIDQAATPGSLVLLAGATLTYYKEASQTVHIYAASALNINGNVAGNIVVLGAL